MLILDTAASKSQDVANTCIQMFERINSFDIKERSRLFRLSRPPDMLEGNLPSHTHRSRMEPKSGIILWPRSERNCISSLRKPAGAPNEPEAPVKSTIHGTRWL
jgi:hypothetical protein